ncbi:MAG: hypothetical protein JXA14_22985 [Anaerolineae bacterium]|nr:hypothetical protein [Anaerolineae bacterium]
MGKRGKQPRSTIRGRFSQTELAVLAAAVRCSPAVWRIRRARCDRRRCYACASGGVIVLAANAVALACKLGQMASGEIPRCVQRSL